MNGAVEWAYGVKPWFEQGLYFPVYTAYSQGRGGTLNGFKIRELFVRPNAHDHTFFYGVNLEFSVNYSYWGVSANYIRSVRPIVGLHLHPFDDNSSIRLWIPSIEAALEAFEFVPGNANRIQFQRQICPGLLIVSTAMTTARFATSFR